LYVVWIIMMAIYVREKLFPCACLTFKYGNFYSLLLL